MPETATVTPLRDEAGVRCGWRAACPRCGWRHDRPDTADDEGGRLIVAALADAHADGGCPDA